MLISPIFSADMRGAAKPKIKANGQRWINRKTAPKKR
jgi:hypothetical protein